MAFGVRTRRLGVVFDEAAADSDVLAAVHQQLLAALGDDARSAAQVAYDVDALLVDIECDCDGVAHIHRIPVAADVSAIAGILDQLAAEGRVCRSTQATGRVVYRRCVT